MGWVGLLCAPSRCDGREEERADPRPACHQAPGTCKLGDPAPISEQNKGLRNSVYATDAVNVILVPTQQAPQEETQTVRESPAHLTLTQGEEGPTGRRERCSSQRTTRTAARRGPRATRRGHRPPDHLHPPGRSKSKSGKRNHKGQELSSGTLETALVSQRSKTKIKGNSKTRREKSAVEQHTSVL